MNRASRRAVVCLVILFFGARLRPAAAESDAPPLVGPFTREDYPQAIIDRPLTLPAGMVEAELGATFASRLFAIPVRGVHGVDDWFADVALRVGVTDRIQVEAATAFSLDHEQRDDGYQGALAADLRPTLASWQHVVPVRLSFLALDTETLDTAATLTVPFVAHASRTLPASRFTNRETVSNSSRVVPEVELAAPTRWRLCDWLWLRAGENLFAVTTGEEVARFAFDVGIGVQAHPLFAMTLDTRIATAFFGGGHEGSQTLADVGTIALTGYFTPLWNLDVVGSLELPDVGAGFDDWATRIAVRYRL